MMPKASQKPPKVTPKWSLFVPMSVLGKLRLDSTSAYGSHVGSCQRPPRDPLKRVLQKDPPKSLPKPTLGVHLGSKAGHLGAKAPQRVAKGSPKGGANDPKIHKKSEKIGPGRPRGSRTPPGVPKRLLFHAFGSLLPECWGSFSEHTAAKKREEEDAPAVSKNSR